MQTVIVNISISDDFNQSQYRKFLLSLLNLFSEDKVFLENRGALVIRQLCVLLNAEYIYRTFAEIIAEETTNIRFASTMIRTLNMILLTSSELFELRNLLKDITNEVILEFLNCFVLEIIFFSVLYLEICQIF